MPFPKAFSQDVPFERLEFWVDNPRIAKWSIPECDRCSEKKTAPLVRSGMLVPRTGLEPARPKAQPPEDCASTNFATWVSGGRKGNASELKSTHFNVLGQTKSVVGMEVASMALNPPNTSMPLWYPRALSMECAMTLRYPPAQWM